MDLVTIGIDTYDSTGLFDMLEIKTFNLGGGIKFIYTRGMAFKMEINYKSMKGSTESSSYNSYDQFTNTISRDVNISILSLSIGVSILF